MELKDDNKIPEILKELNKLDKMHIYVGVFGADDSFMVMIASVNEFGARIKPKVARYLTIPLKKKYRGKSPCDFDLFFYESKEGNKFLVREKGKDQLEFAYMLAQEVNIPERSFLRSTFDQNEKKWFSFAKKQLEKIMTGEISAKEACDRLGARMQSDVQKTIRNVRTPPNAPSTVASKGSSNPLIDSGRMRQSIIWKVEDDG